MSVLQNEELLDADDGDRPLLRSDGLVTRRLAALMAVGLPCPEPLKTMKMNHWSRESRKLIRMGMQRRAWLKLFGEIVSALPEITSAPQES